jgi:hypothetical protein
MKKYPNLNGYKSEMKKELIIESNKYYANRIECCKSKTRGLCEGHDWNYWHESHAVTEAKLAQLREDAEDELQFLINLRRILNSYRSQITLVKVGRENVLSDVDNELMLDERIRKIKDVMKK